MIKKITALILSLSLSLCSTAAFSFTDNKDIKEDTLYENMMKQKKSTIIELEDLSIKELTKLRDKALDENLSMSSYDMSYRKEGILDPNWDFGLVAFLNNNYGELTEKENLIKQIQLIEYATLYKDVLDPSGEVFKVLNEDYQISEYLIKHGKTYEISTQENLEFLIENIEDVVDYVDFDAKTVVEIIDPTIKGSFISNDEIRKAEATEYAKKTGVYINDKTGGTLWWLRSPGYDGEHAAGVDFRGWVYTDGYGIDSSYDGIRPAIWVSLEEV